MERIMLNEAKALVLRNHDEVWSQGNIDAVDEIFAPDFVGHHPGQPDWVGPDAVKQAVVNARTAFPDFAEHVEDVIVTGDRVVTRFTASGTHMGPYRGLAPTGRRMQIVDSNVLKRDHLRQCGNGTGMRWFVLNVTGA